MDSSPLPAGKPVASRSPEFELLLLAARMRVDGPAAARLRALVHEEIDWDFVITTAHRQHVLPIVARTLGACAPEGMPEFATRRFQHAVLGNVKRSLFLTNELLQIIDLLNAQGIESIAYKGPVLAALVYGNVALRQFSDLDIIVRPEHVVRARTLLIARGYRPERPLSDEQLLGLMLAEKDITLLRDDLGVNLEIHWGITTENDPIRVAPASLWEHVASCAIGGRTVQALPTDDLLLMLCIHGARHLWTRLGWICDVAEITRSQKGLDWDLVMDKASRLGGARILLLGLALARNLLGAEFPPRVIQAIEADPVLDVLCAQVRGWLFSEHPVPLDLGERERFLIKLREHPADRLRVALRQASLYLGLTARDQEALPLPPYLRWALYVLRPVRLAGQYGLTPVKRFLTGIFQS